MIAAFSSPAFIDALIVFVLVEAIAIFAFAPKLRKSPDIWLTLASGAGLMLAIRAALAGADGRAIGASLAFALVAHLFYLRARIRL